jgi:phosphate transport system permease protein
MNEEEPSLQTRSTRRRARQTRKSVATSNAAAHALISFGGISTIIAVLLVCVFLVSVVVPLFLPSKVKESGEFRFSGDTSTAAVQYVALNDYLTMGWRYSPDGLLQAFRLDTGAPLDVLRPLGDRVPTAVAFDARQGLAAFGFADGSIQYGTVGFATQFLSTDELKGDLGALSHGSAVAYEGGMLELTPEGQYRLQKLQVEMQEPVVLDEGSAIRLIDISMKSGGPIVAAASASDTLYVSEVRTRKNLLTGEVKVNISGGKTAIPLPGDGSKPSWLLVSGLGDQVYATWQDGRLLRYNTRDAADPTLMEQLDLVPETGVKLTDLAFQMGKASLIAGDDRGRARIWFNIRPEDAVTSDGFQVVLAGELKAGNAAVTSMSSSARTRIVAIGYEDGHARLFHTTSKRTLADVSLPGERGGPISAVAIGPKDNALLAVSKTSAALWSFDASSPEITLAAIFGPVWYEGFDKPEYVWQSSSATDNFEPKYGMYPLIFGTIKATLYSMLFGLPLALLAAVYTSEMMNPKVKLRVKPVIEMMASLPSVVLGFLAALVVAPFVEDIVPQVMTSFVAVPFAILGAAYIWQLMPRKTATRLARYRLVAMTTAVGFGVWLGFLMGPTVQRTLFAGDIKEWLAGSVGSGAGGWMFLLLPLSCVFVALVFAREVTPRIRRVSIGWSESRVAWTELAKFLIGSTIAIALAYAVSKLLANGPMGLWSFDPRGSFLGTYIQRNALIVGFIMGFAIIPIIYTISEDALSAVPEHLRSASLASGATQWQTALRIIVPTAASGLFSAVMIGLGRAVGETMIVLMAAGNTPILDWNIFNGFRTLSANIAVELPEAVKDSTHYRMLFLCALVLFVMTFILNTVAEAIRQRFRRRAFEL